VRVFNWRSFATFFRTFALTSLVFHFLSSPSLDCWRVSHICPSPSSSSYRRTDWTHFCISVSRLCFILRSLVAHFRFLLFLLSLALLSSSSYLLIEPTLQLSVVRTSLERIMQTKTSLSISSPFLPFRSQS